MNCSTTGLDPEQCDDIGAYERARMALMVRKRRALHFNKLIFSDPAWDVLLHLFVREPANGAMNLTSLVEAAGTSPSLMTRWLAVLMDEQLVQPAAADSAGEPTFAITEHGRQSMLEVFSV